MCLQCNTNAVRVCDLSEHFVLMVSQRDDYVPGRWDKGDYAIVECNDPDIVFSGITFGFELGPDDESQSLADTPEEERYWEECRKMEQILNGVDYGCLMRVYEAFRKQYTKYSDPINSDDPSFNFWLYEFISKKLKGAKNGTNPTGDWLLSRNRRGTGVSSLLHRVLY